MITQLTCPETQPFGKLEIECRRGVLIPRWETEEWSTLFAERIDQFVDSRANDNELKVLDLCTGSACIALNIASLLHTRNIKILGLDVSLKAVNLANRNLRRNKHLLPAEIELEFGAVDIFFKEAEQHILEADVITMNPPYILQEDEQQISLSTRRYEPRSALVPSEAAGSGELFYARVIEILTNKHCRVHLLAFEIGSASQAERVKKMISNRLGWQSTIMQDSAGKSRCVLANKPA